MEPFESHSFIVKVWLEELPEGDGPAAWRGHVTHVPSQARRYLHTLDEVIDFVGPYLESWGIALKGYRQVDRPPGCDAPDPTPVDLMLYG